MMQFSVSALVCMEKNGEEKNLRDEILTVSHESCVFSISNKSDSYEYSCHDSTLNCFEALFCYESMENL